MIDGRSLIVIVKVTWIRKLKCVMWWNAWKGLLQNFMFSKNHSTNAYTIKNNIDE